MAPVMVATGCQKAVGVKTTPLCSGMGGGRIIPQATVEPPRRGEMYEKTTPLCSGMGGHG